MYRCEETAPGWLISMPANGKYPSRLPIASRKRALAALVAAATLLFPAVARQSVVLGSAQANSAAPAQAAKARVSQEIQLTGDQIWVDTAIDVQPGERLVFSSTGTLRYAD